MRLRQRLLLSLVVLLCPFATIHAHEVESITYSGSPQLRDSRWGFIGALQQALNHELKSCPPNLRTTIAVDGVFGQSTRSMLDLLGRCKGNMQLINGSAITHAAVSELFPRDKIPTTVDRALMLNFTLSGTDYDCMQWHVSSCPRKSANYYRSAIRLGQCSDREAPGYSFSWGPFGATGSSPGASAEPLSRRPSEATELLRILSRKDSDRLYQIFADANADGLRDILQYRVSGPHESIEPLEELYQSVCEDEGQRNAWKTAFKNLGKEQFVREAYDDYAFSRAWLLAGLKKRYAIYDDVGLEPTEVDFAFVLDRTVSRGYAVHNGKGNCRIQDRYWDLYDLFSGAVTDNALMRYAFVMCAQDSDPSLDRSARDLVFLRKAFGPSSTLERKATDRERGRAFMEKYRQAVGKYKSSFGSLTAETAGLRDDRSGPSKGGLSKLRRTQW